MPVSKALWQSLGFTVSRELDDGKTLDFEITRAEYEKIDQQNFKSAEARHHDDRYRVTSEEES